MKISIITVCRNAEASIEATIQSVIKQTCKDIEYIIIDGASTDGTLSIIDRYKDQIDKIISEPDKGLYDAMNKGIKEASGEFVYFLNSEDILLHENVISVVAKKLKHSKEDIIYGDILLANKKIGNGYLTQQNKVNKFYFFKQTLAHQSVFTRKTAFDKIGDYKSNYKVVSDFEWFLRALKSDLTFKHIDIIVAMFFLGGISSDPNQNAIFFKERNEVVKTYFTGYEMFLYNILLIIQNSIDIIFKPLDKYRRKAH